MSAKRAVCALLASAGLICVVGRSASVASVQHPSRAFHRWPRFVKEVVRVEIRPPMMRVRGVYHFAGSAPGAKVPILYPFVADTLLGPPTLEQVIVRGAGGRSDAASRLDGDGLHVIVPFDARGAATLETTYSQELLGRRASYLLSSTRRWDAPLDAAEFEVSCPATFPPCRFSYRFQLVSELHGVRTYRYRARHFLPSTELVVEW